MASASAPAAGSQPSDVPLPLPPSPARGRLLPLGPSHLDAFLTQLHRSLATPSGIDTVLQMGWAASRLTAILLARRRGAAAPVLAKTGLSLETRLRALAALLAEARSIMRLWGLLAMYLWARRLAASLTASASTPAPAAAEKAKSRLLAAADDKAAWLSATQLVASATFQVCDNANTLARHGVLLRSPAQQAATARLGARAWSVFLGSEIGRLGLVLAGQAGQAATAEERAVVLRLQKSIVRNAAWAPIIFSGAVGGGLISEMTGAVLAMIPSVIMMKDLWRDTAPKEKAD